MKVVKWGVHGTGTCIGPGILLLVEKNINPLIINQKHRMNQIILKQGANHFHG